MRRRIEVYNINFILSILQIKLVIPLKNNYLNVMECMVAL